MSFADEHAESSRPGPDAARVLTHADLIDLKYPAERARSCLQRMPRAIHEGETATLYELCGQLCSELDAIVNNLDLDSIEDECDDDDGPDPDELPPAGPPNR